LADVYLGKKYEGREEKKGKMQKKEESGKINGKFKLKG
jgi:hypothetical protein